MRVKHSSGLIPLVSKEIVEIKALELDVGSEKPGVKIGNEELKEAVVEAEVEKKRGKWSGDSEMSAGSRSDASVDPENIGWGRWYSLKELEIATRGFAEENMIGEGGYGVVYRGVMQDGSVVAVKNLLNNKYVEFEIFRVCLFRWIGDVSFYMTSYFSRHQIFREKITRLCGLL